MRSLLRVLVASALTGCAAMRQPATPGSVYGTIDAALDCAQETLERKGFQVQGEDVGARSYERLVPGRRKTEVLGRQRSVGTNELAYVRVAAYLADSTPTFRLKAQGFTTTLDGTDRPAVLHEQGVAAVVSGCGATR